MKHLKNKRNITTLAALLLVLFLITVLYRSQDAGYATKTEISNPQGQSERQTRTVLRETTRGGEIEEVERMDDNSVYQSFKSLLIPTPESNLETFYEMPEKITLVGSLNLTHLVDGQDGLVQYYGNEEDGSVFGTVYQSQKNNGIPSFSDEIGVLSQDLIGQATYPPLGPDEAFEIASKNHEGLTSIDGSLYHIGFGGPLYRITGSNYNVIVVANTGQVITEKGAIEQYNQMFGE